MSLLMVILTLIGGLTLSAQSSINGTLSKKTGTFETAFLTFATGAMILTIVVVFFGQGNILSVFAVPKWQLTCALFGASYLFLTVLAVPKIGVTAANISTVIGQLFASMIIDHFGWFGSKEVPFDLSRWIGVAFMLLALYFIFKGNKKTAV
ncbi:DMT family transporter [Priestia megaterium]|uniref:DMT family transporter n=1 Tax=Priestia megaterium TaxID=1404 RepID=UPI002858703D|nr:DMT family transporter [Priestia megaterium]MDR7242278.1 transporter family-2 protein [Priestia megaterium]